MQNRQYIIITTYTSFHRSADHERNYQEELMKCLIMARPYLNHVKEMAVLSAMLAQGQCLNRSPERK